MAVYTGAALWGGRQTVKILTLLLAILVAGHTPATAQSPAPAQPQAQAAPTWPDTFVTRLGALALMQTLSAEILGSRSATTSLERWCQRYGLATEPRVVAHRIAGPAKALTPEQRERLKASDSEVRYRRVQLRCGEHVLSEAENWYVPGRLTTEMNDLLDRTDTSFGRVVQALQPYRQTFAVSLLWSPLPDGWERASVDAAPCATAGPLVMPDALFEHRAVLYTRDQVPFSEVHEVYQRQILAFRAPGPCRTP